MTFQQLLKRVRRMFHRKRMRQADLGDENMEMKAQALASVRATERKYDAVSARLDEIAKERKRDAIADAMDGLNFGWGHKPHGRNH